MALDRGDSTTALADWKRLQQGLSQQNAQGLGLAKLDHNISVATAISQAR